MTEKIETTAACGGGKASARGLNGSVLALGAVALALLLTLFAAPASADCGSTVQQGSYDRDSNVFTPGTAATDDDIRITCTESTTDTDAVITLDSLDFDSITLPTGFGTGSYIVVALNGTAPLSARTGLGSLWVVTASGIETAATNSNADGIDFVNTDSNSLSVETRGTVTTRGAGSRGVSMWTGTAGSSTLINIGTVNTHGGVDTTGTFDRPAHGITAGSETDAASVTNYGHVETRGSSAESMLAYAATDGTAIATNYGTAIVRGGVHIQTIQSGTESSTIGRPLTAGAVLAYSETGDAHAVNNGNVEAHGVASEGVKAEAGGWSQSGGTGTAVAENFGTVTSSGAFYELTDANSAHSGAVRVPTGVAASSQGAGEARAVNHESGTITTTGDGAPGLNSWSGQGDGAANAGTASVTAINRGTIVTRGDRVVTQVNSWEFGAYGINAESENARATAENAGTVDTYGTRAHGVRAWTAVGAGTATVTNSGDVTTHNTEADPAGSFGYGAYGMWAAAESGNAQATNEASGRITTKGPWGFGFLAETRNDGTSTGAWARAVNRGTVTTEGDDSDGVMATGHGGSASNPNAIIARNEAGARITTQGDRSDGLIAWINGGDTATVYGSVRAENHGTIVTSGAAESADEAIDTDAGVRALFASFGSTSITDAGDATIVNTGDVTVTGAGMTGLGARTYGSGSATVRVTDGSVTASAEDDSTTADIDESGIGISAWTGDTGTASVTVSGNARVTAPIAARLFGGTTNLLVNDGQLTGDVVFGDGTSTLETRGFGLIDGDVTFGAGGDDTLILNVLADLGISGITGDITGVEEMIKRGSGIARVNNAMFTGSSLTIEGGSLIVSGHVDLGASGTVTVEDAGKLTVEVGDIGSDSTDHGRITAGGGVTLEGDDPAVFAAYAPGLTGAQRNAARERLRTDGFTPFSDGTDVTASGGGDVTLQTEDEGGEGMVVGTFASDGTAVLGEDADLATGQEIRRVPPVTPVAAAGGGGGGGGAGAGLAVGGGAAIVALLLSLFSDDEEAIAGSFMPVPSTLGSADGEAVGARHWVHTLTDRMPGAAGTAGSLQGLNMGFATRLGDGFHLGLSGMPHVQAALGDDALQGHRYALQGGWSTDDLFASVSLTRGEYTARTAFTNLDNLGTLGGAFGLRHEQAQAEVGTSFGIGGLSLDPTLSLVAGSLDREAYTAESAALRSEIPAFSQRYAGWKAGVSLAPTEWLDEGSVRWRPELNLATAQTATDGPGDFRVRQADKAGVLHFSTSAKAEPLPQTVHALGATVSIARSETWKMRGGYFAMMADGELVHAAVARFRLRF